MPIKDNAKKALRQSTKRAAENKVVKDAYKAAMKAVSKALAAGADTKELIIHAQQKLDKAAKKGILKPNTAARKLSRLMKRVQRIETK